MLTLKTDRKKGEGIRLFLSKIGALDKEREIETKDAHIFIPLKRELTAEEKKKAGKAEYIRKKLKGRDNPARSLKEALKGKLTEQELALLKKSFDIIGDIAVLLVPAELEKKEKDIANAILEVHKNVRTVCKRTGAVEGDFRVRPVEIMAGEKRTRTIAKENKYSFELDLAEVFYTPRLATERERIAAEVGKEEIVIDMFTGVGPFAIPIAKKCRKVYAIDLNPQAYKYLELNIKRNKTENVVPILGDAAKVNTLVPEKADRIIMNLPKYAFGFLKYAAMAVKKGGIIHYHCFGKEEEIDELAEKAKKEIGPHAKIIGKRAVRQTSPKEYNWAIDIKA